MTQSEKTLCEKEKLLVLNNFFFCHYVFKKLSAAQASESIYMRERVKSISVISWRLMGKLPVLLVHLSCNPDT